MKKNYFYYKLIAFIVFMIAGIAFSCTDMETYSDYSYIQFINVVPNSAPLDLYFNIFSTSTSDYSSNIVSKNIAYTNGSNSDGAYVKLNEIAYKKMAPKTFYDIYALLYTSNSIPDFYNVFGKVDELKLNENTYYTFYCAGIALPIETNNEKATRLYIDSITKDRILELQNLHPSSSLVKVVNFCADCTENINIFDNESKELLFSDIEYSKFDNDYIAISPKTITKESLLIREINSEEDLNLIPKTEINLEAGQLYTILVYGIKNVIGFKSNEDTRPSNFTSDIQYLNAKINAEIIKISPN